MECELFKSILSIADVICLLSIWDENHVWWTPRIGGESATANIYLRGLRRITEDSHSRWWVCIGWDTKLGPPEYKTKALLR